MTQMKSEIAVERREQHDESRLRFARTALFFANSALQFELQRPIVVRTAKP
jgi:hypothetical protein